jgi:hypothetical protein
MVIGNEAIEYGMSIAERDGVNKERGEMRSRGFCQSGLCYLFPTSQARTA